MSTPRPDWYQDPADSSIERWWNGRAWSYQTRASLAAALNSAVVETCWHVPETWSIPDVPEELWDSFDSALLTGPYGMTSPKPLEVAVR